MQIASIAKRWIDPIVMHSGVCPVNMVVWGFARILSKGE